MREIKFRGKTKETGDYVYGSLSVEYDGTTFIVWWENELKEAENNYWEPVCKFKEVEPETVGQYIPKYDLYEKDKVRVLYTDWGSKSETDNRTIEQYLYDIAKDAEVYFNGSEFVFRFWGEKYQEYYEGSLDVGKYGRIFR